MSSLRSRLRRSISTYIALYDYGYTNVYELGAQLDIGASVLQFEAGPSPARSRVDVRADLHPR